MNIRVFGQVDEGGDESSAIRKGDFEPNTRCSHVVRSEVV